MSENFNDVVQAAVNDLSANGFDSAERVAYWQDRIRRAAEASLGTTQEMERLLRADLHATYKRLIEDGGVLQRHPEVQRFTVERIKPKLRNELDRRIMASADLIKLNRKQAIDKTLQRFSGWASSVPAGGSKNVDKGEEKATVKKSMRALPFEERRVLIDQGHKLVASINAVIATDAGAVAMRWHSRWRQAGYNYRPDHKERDELVYLLKDSWARQAGFVKPSPAGIYENVTAVAEEPFCRCYATWLYSLRQMPEDMVTAKGRAEMERVRAQIAELAK